MIQKHLIILTNTLWSLQRQKHYHNLKILRSTYAPQSVKAHDYFGLPANASTSKSVKGPLMVLQNL